MSVSTIDPERASPPARAIVEIACRAPSVHNTQPWLWRADGPTLDLYADQSRRLKHADPTGRTLMMSCGAALHHAQVAARGLGWRPTVSRLPDPGQPDLLARIELAPEHLQAAGVEQLRLLQLRSTDRRRFTMWPVNSERLDALRVTAAEWGCAAVPITAMVPRYRVEHLMSRAQLIQVADPALSAEQQRWVNRDDQEGVPSRLVPVPSDGPPSRRPRFDLGELEEVGRQVESSDTLVVLGTAGDTVHDWLTTGEALSALWLTALHEGLSVVPLSQVTEVVETREALRHDVLEAILGLELVPHLLLRVGWQAISRSELLSSPRRPIADVLLEASGEGPEVPSAGATGPDTE